MMNEATSDEDTEDTGKSPLIKIENKRYPTYLADKMSQVNIDFMLALGKIVGKKSLDSLLIVPEQCLVIENGNLYCRFNRGNDFLDVHGVVLANFNKNNDASVSLASLNYYKEPFYVLSIDEKISQDFMEVQEKKQDYEENMTGKFSLCGFFPFTLFQTPPLDTIELMKNIKADDQFLKVKIITPTEWEITQSNFTEKSGLCCIPSFKF